MSKKNIDIVHWTPKEESLIAEYLPRIKSESGKFVLSTKSTAWKELRMRFTNRTETALNIKVRSMLGRNPKKTVNSQFKPKSDKPEGLLKDLYGTVSYDQFITLYNTLN